MEKHIFCPSLVAMFWDSASIAEMIFRRHTKTTINYYISNTTVWITYWKHKSDNQNCQLTWRLIFVSAYYFDKSQFKYPHPTLDTNYK